MKREDFLFELLAVGAGGFFGSIFRYLLSLIPLRGDFPLRTLLTNVIGAFLIGLLIEASGEWLPLSHTRMLFLKTGFCGGFTTFSTFSAETAVLLREGRYGWGALYAVSSVLLCVAGVFLGFFTARVLLRRAH